MSSAGKNSDAGDPAPAGRTQYLIGAEVRCNAGVCGTLSRVVVDPVAKVLTHLVVEPTHRKGLGRLVPLELVDMSSGETALRCSMVEFERLDAAEETDFLPGTTGYGGYGAGQALSWPYYTLGGFGATAGLGDWGPGIGNATPAVTYDAIPSGEVSVRRGERVHAIDGDIGHVEGLVIDASTHHVTHVLLQEGHLFSRKDVAIPIRSVTRVSDLIDLDMTKKDVDELPEVDIDRPLLGP